MKILHLTLKKKWFDMIASGEKKEEYREIKPYYESRFIDHNIINDISFKDFNNGAGLKNYDQVQFRNGYAKDAPSITLTCKGISIKEGNPKWGAVEGEKYFVIELGNIVNPN